jgi:uncharacterized protein YbjT (DUF2867 family)
MILITGATGTNGHLVVEALLQAGVSFRAMVQNASKATDLQRERNLVVADFDKPETLDSALAGLDRCLLLSAVDERLVEPEARFVERAKQAGLRHLVKFSAIGAHRRSRGAASTDSPSVSSWTAAWLLCSFSPTSSGKTSFGRRTQSKRAESSTAQLARRLPAT